MISYLGQFELLVWPHEVESCMGVLLEFGFCLNPALVQNKAMYLCKL